MKTMRQIGIKIWATSFMNDPLHHNTDLTPITPDGFLYTIIMNQDRQKTSVDGWYLLYMKKTIHDAILCLLFSISHTCHGNFFPFHKT